MSCFSVEPEEVVAPDQGGDVRSLQAAAEKLDAELAQRAGVTLPEERKGLGSLLQHAHQRRQSLQHALESALHSFDEEWQRAVSSHIHLLATALKAADSVPAPPPGISDASGPTLRSSEGRADAEELAASVRLVSEHPSGHEMVTSRAHADPQGLPWKDQSAGVESGPHSDDSQEASWEVSFRRALRRDVQEAVAESLEVGWHHGRSTVARGQEGAPAAAGLPPRSSVGSSECEPLPMDHDWRRHLAEERTLFGSTTICFQVLAQRLQLRLPKCCMGVRSRLFAMATAIAKAQEPKRVGPLAHVVQSTWFEMLTLMLILGAVVFSAVSLDMEMNHAREGTSSPITTIAIVESAFVICFVVELALKMQVHGKFFFFNQDASWNILDVFLVALGVVEVSISWSLVVGADQDAQHGAHSTVFLRCIRFAKVIRLLRALKAIKFMEELRLMIDCLLWSAASIFWMLMLVFGVVFLFALVIMSGMVNHAKVNPASVKAIRVGFGSVSETALTLIKSCTGGEDWGESFQAIQEIDGPLSLVFVFFILFFQLVLLNVVTSMFLEEVMKLAQPSADTILFEKSQLELKDIQAIQRLFREMDFDEDGEISMKEFLLALDTKHELGVFLATCGVDIKDARAFFKLVAQRQGSMRGEDLHRSIEDIVANCARMRGYATAVDLQIFRNELNHKLQKIKEDVSNLSRI